MRKQKTFKVRDKELTAYELTVKEIMQIIESLDNPELDDLDLLFPDRLPSAALFASMKMTKAKIAKYTVSELELMYDAVEEINPTFAGLIKRLANIGREVLSAKSDEPAVN
jgi:hypothetical protein